MTCGGASVFSVPVGASDSPMPEIRQQYEKAIEDFARRGFIVHEVPMEEACKLHTHVPQLGKNMFVLGMLCHIYNRELDRALEEVGFNFEKKSEQVIAINRTLVQAGYEFAKETVEYRFEVPTRPSKVPMIVTNGNQAVGLGIMASGRELLAMYPITPATAATHFISGVFQEVGGFVHHAEDESRLCYDTVSSRGLGMPVEDKIKGLNRSLDLFAT